MALAIASCLVPSLLFADGMWRAYMVCALFVAALALFVRTVSPATHRSYSSRRRFFRVSFVWVWASLLASLPFLATGVTHSFSDAFFEALSAITTTGMTALPSVASLPPSVVFLRSLLQWLGGFAIMYLVVVIAPMLGISNYSLYAAEGGYYTPGNRYVSSSSSSFRHLLFIYILLTALFVLLFCRSGLDFFTSVNVTFVTVSTGGFSFAMPPLTPYQQYLAATAMMFGGLNITVIYLFLSFRWNKLEGRREQLFCYLMLFVALAAVITLAKMGSGSFADTMRAGVVQAAGAVSTTGFMAGGYDTMSSSLLFLILLVVMCGGMAGSASGGLKVMRLMVLVRNVRQSLYKRLRPVSVMPVRLNGHPVSHSVINNVMVLFMVYGLLALVGIFLLIIFGEDANTAVGSILGCLTTYGHAMGIDSTATLSLASQWVCAFYMLLGRLECLVVLAVFL